MSDDNLGDAAAGNNLPVRKRKKAGDDEPEPDELKKYSKIMEESEAAATDEDGMKPLNRGPISKARQVRLEQNRKAARESRRRKKVMIEELQRSVIFFSRANSTLKQQNDELGRLFMQVQSQISAIESGQQQSLQPGTTQGETQLQQMNNQGEQQQQAQAVAQQAMYESQGFPAAAARTAAQTMNAGASGDVTATPAPADIQSQATGIPAMQTGATMQAMANFQQAAAAAMASAMGMNPAATVAPGMTPQQAYTDTLNALAMQQAAAAAAGQQFAFIPQMQFQGMQFPGMQFAPAPAAPALSGQEQQQLQQQDQQHQQSQQDQQQQQQADEI
jgi:hypothetical protein